MRTVKSMMVAALPSSVEATLRETLSTMGERRKRANMAEIWSRVMPDISTFMVFWVIWSAVREPWLSISCSSRSRAA